MTFVTTNHDSTCNCDVCKMYSEKKNVYYLFDALRNGFSITNGPQIITFSPELNKGYLTCYDPDCCDLEFDGLYEILKFIECDEWEIA